MAGPACKTIIDNQTSSLSRSLFEILTSPLVRGCMLPAERCDELIQRLANIDIDTFHGPAVSNLARGEGLLDIVRALEAEGVLTAEIWAVLPHPAEGIRRSREQADHS